MTDDTIACPFEECDAGPWPDTYGADGGRLKRMVHLYEAHRGDCQGRMFNQIDRL